MSAIDAILNGTERIVQEISEEQGVLAAERFVRAFNNACLQLAGFEEFLQEVKQNTNQSFIAPINNMSESEH